MEMDEPAIEAIGERKMECETAERSKREWSGVRGFKSLVFIGGGFVILRKREGSLLFGGGGGYLLL